MPELFKLVAESSTGVLARAGTVAGEAKLTIKPGKVKFNIEPSNGLKASSAKLNQQGGSGGFRDFTVSGNNVVPLELELSTEGSSDCQALVTYKSTESGADVEVTTNKVNITVDSGAPNGEENGGAPVNETSIGGYDKVFTYVLLAIVVVACLAISLAVWTVVQRILLPNSAETGVELFGTWAERTAAITILVALGAGVVVLLLGAWLAALETRGRLHLRVPVEKTRGGVSESLKALAEVIEKFKTVRGSIAVLIVGAVVVGAACWAAASMATIGNSPSPTGGTESPATSPVNTLTPSGAPSTAPTGG